MTIKLPQSISSLRYYFLAISALEARLSVAEIQVEELRLGKNRSIQSNPQCGMKWRHFRHYGGLDWIHSHVFAQKTVGLFCWFDGLRICGTLSNWDHSGLWKSLHQHRQRLRPKLWYSLRRQYYRWNLHSNNTTGSLTQQYIYNSDRGINTHSPCSTTGGCWW